MPEDIVKKSLRESLKKLSHYFFAVVISCLVLIHIASGIYQISENEQGVLLRFGKVIDSHVMPGIHYRFPWPVDEIIKVPVKTVHSFTLSDFAVLSMEQYGYYEDEDTNDYQSEDEPEYDPTEEYSDEMYAYCITGDNNIVFAEFEVKYTIIDPAKYLFNMKGSEETINHLGASAIIQCFSVRPVDELLTYGKKECESFIKHQMQNRLDFLNSGIAIHFIEIKDCRPPNEVQPDFEKVINAQIHKRKMINEAESYVNGTIARAQGKASKAVEEALAEKNERNNKAMGDADRFLSRLSEYQKSKSITRRNIYFDFMKKNYPLLENVVIIDNNETKKIVDLKMISR